MNIGVIPCLLAVMLLTLPACKTTSTSGTSEAGASHLGNQQWRDRFGVNFNQTQVARAIVRISQYQNVERDQVISQLPGWPESEESRLPEAGPLRRFVSTATGFLISPGGYSLTNYHVINECVGFRENIWNRPRRCANTKAILGDAFNENNFALSQVEVASNSAQAVRQTDHL